MSLRAAFERLLAPGYGWCYRCKRPWKYAEPHTTWYSESAGCFPLCETCWTRLGAPEARRPYYERHIQEDRGGEDRRAILSAMEAGR